MSYTDNLTLEKPVKGANDWNVSMNSNMDLIDAAYGNNLSAINDLPQVYVETGTFNYTSGDVITLPTSVDSTNEYNVSVVPTSRSGAIGDIYITKTTSNFTVYCSENNTTDTYAATIYYIGDVSSYGGSIYRRYYVSPDASITDHGDQSAAGSLANILNTIGSSPAIVELPGNKTYDLVNYSVTGNDNIDIIYQKGAKISIGSGRMFTHNGAIIAGSGQIISMTDRDSFVYGGPTALHSQWLGAEHDGATDDSNALNDMIGACSSDGATVIIDSGTTRCNSVIFDIDNLTIFQFGVFKPFTDTGFCIRIGGTSTTTVSNVTAFNIDVDSGSDYESYTTVVACQVQNLYSSEIHFRRIEGCKKGIYLTNGGAVGVVYNRFYLGRIVDNEQNLSINPANSGWVNENEFYGGRFSHFSGKSDYSNAWHIRIEYNATYNPNANKFYGPSLEGSGYQAFYCDGISNSVKDARIEMTGTYTDDTITFGSNSARNEFTTSYSDGLLSDGVSVTDTITSVYASQFTVNSDLTSQFWNGQVLQVTLDDATVNLGVVYGSSYSAPDMTVRLVHELPDYVSTTNEIDSIKYLPITDDGRGNRLFLSRVDYPSISNLAYEKSDETMQYREGGLALRGLGSNIPALSLAPGGSASNNVLTISNFNGYTIGITGNGNITAYDPSTGYTAFEFDSSNNRVAVYDASNNASIRIDGKQEAIRFLQSNDGSGVSNNSFFMRSSDNKPCWKDNSGTIKALY